MTWFKVDDGFWSHPKSVDLTPEAVALWVRAGSYCGKHLTDGYVPKGRLGMLQGSPEAAYELVAAGLWLEVVDGWQFHDWSVYQDTKDAVEKRRESWKQRAAARREAEQAAKDKAPAKKTDTSLISIPFHSIHTADSTLTSTVESTVESTVDAPLDPVEVSAVVADIRSQLRRAR